MARHKWIQTLREDPDHPGEILLDLTRACEILGWRPGDRLEWIDNKDGSWSIQRAPDTQSDQ